ncbi:NAD(P)H-binding protein, partial [Streptomyces sp. NPDC046881]|uniref:NAD(P)H-binding protein n=1 Tax=Streptomyces sp. NPDC046881 TaxID=3155374 RepID=UPI0034106907
MHIVIAGGHGKIARRLTRLLSARGDNVTGLIRNPDHADDLRADGAEPVVCDLEHASVHARAAPRPTDSALRLAGAPGADGDTGRLT